ncbi:MAG: GNAT family N-acetyltransferase [Mesorhizobium sp.]|uniref:GNAT family N-acetyltransferase n=1 Tax=Mesorhizobium sp. TaxID=1871066 RepID=UPI00121DC9A4|nr:GNAT family N-acetyltransferase [Mesorhizobium sp.]TIQ17844.1 MAG: GNAT family N-acetyltransferase [Mesorhizobium sp.]
MEIRVVRPNDLSQLRELCEEHAALEGATIADRDLSAKWNSAFFGTPAQLVGWVCDEGDNRPDALTGYMTASIRLSTWSAKPYLYLDCIYLRPEVRRSGMGRAMFGILTQFARESGCKEIQWQTLLSNEGGIAFYHSLGAVPTLQWSRWSLSVD